MTRPRMTEADLQRAVIDLCKVLGLLVHHVRPARTKDGWRTPIEGHKGHPDLSVVGPNGALIRELKSDVGRLTPEQRKWISAYQQAGVDADVWRPQNFPHQVRTELEALK